MRDELATAHRRGECERHGRLAVITRDDSTKQWAYKGKPLYTYRMDAKEAT